ncbi:hypothetical protein BJ944DRAFT_243552 [Cunninghamella echinulata]|nr:hypothetical protein BJ944DRAFT_243552 [Cunninghamella echinulata]
MSEDKKGKQIQEMTANLFKSEKESYLQLSYKKVLEHLGIQSRNLFSKKDCIPMKEINDKVIEDISKNHIKLTRAIGIVDEGNEYKRQDFVLSVIVNIVAEYYDKNVEILREEQIDGEEVKEAIEIIIISGYTWEFIWCKGNGENNSNDIKSSIIWNYEQKFDPIETSVEINRNNGKVGWHHL